jgi:hypothetical protein
MRLILLGASGMVGAGALREALEALEVEAVLASGGARAAWRTRSCGSCSCPTCSTSQP